MAEAADNSPKGSRSEMTGDELSNIRKRSNTIVSISDDGNQDKYKKEISEKIKANLQTLQRLKVNCLEESRQRGRDLVSSDDC